MADGTSNALQTCAVGGTAVQYDATLDARVRSDIVRCRFKRSVFAALSLLIIVGQLSISAAILVTTVRAPDQAHGALAIVLSAFSAFLLTLDASLSIRERASVHHATLTQLTSIRNQMQYPNTSPLWQEYGDVRAYSKINYIEAICDCCSWRVPESVHVFAPSSHAATDQRDIT